MTKLDIINYIILLKNNIFKKQKPKNKQLNIHMLHSFIIRCNILTLIPIIYKTKFLSFYKSLVSHAFVLESELRQVR